MKLSIQERIYLSGVLPKESDFSTLKIVRDLENDLSLSETEYKKYDIVAKAQGGRLVMEWNDAGKKYKKEVKIGEKAFDIIVAALRELEKKRKLPISHMDIYERFVLAK